MTIRASLSPLLLVLSLLAAGTPARAGKLVPLDPGPVREANARDEAALREAFYQGYGRGFPGFKKAQDDPSSLAGAFVTFQKALVLLSAEGGALKDGLASNTGGGSVSAWFDPAFPPQNLAARSGGRLLPSGYKITDENSDRDPPQLYAPDENTLRDVVRLAERMRRLQGSRDREEIARLEGEFLDLMRREVRSMQGVAGGRTVAGLGFVERGGRMQPITLNPSVIEQGLGDVQAPDTPAAPVTTTGTGSGAPRGLTPQARAYFAYIDRSLQEDMTPAEMDLFLLNNDGGFHLRSSPRFLEGDIPDPRDGRQVVNSDLYLMPVDLMGSSLSLDSRRNR